jgi:hypothetical protein
MDKDIVKRKVKREDVKKIIDLHNETYRKTRNVEDWYWEYEGHYPESYVYVVFDRKGTIAGTQGMIPIYMYFKNKKYFIGKSESSLVLPEYRGEYYFKDLYEYAMALCKDQNMHCVWGFTSAVKVLRDTLHFKVYENSIKEAKIVFSKGATLFVNLQEQSTSFITSHQTKRTTVRKSGSALFNILKGLRLSRSKDNAGRPEPDQETNISDTNYVIEEKPRSINDIDMLYKRLRIKHANLIHLNMDKKYIEWRIEKNPHINFKSNFVYEGEFLRAYCYYNPSKETRIVHMSDLTFEDYNAGIFLLNNMLNKLKAEKFAYLRFFGNIDNPLMAEVFRLLQTYGASIDASSQSYVLRNILFSDEKSLYNIKNWYINGLWTEGDTM